MCILSCLSYAGTQAEAVARTQVFRLETRLANFIARHFIFVLPPHCLRYTDSLLYPMSFKTYGHWNGKNLYAAVF